MIILLLILSSTFHNYFAQTVFSACGDTKPFKGKDNNCYDFTEICVKKDDPVCNSFLKSCDQCPANKTVVMTLVNFLNNRKIQSVSNMEELRTQIIKLNGKLESMSTTILVINLVLFIFTIVILVPLICIRFRKSTKRYSLEDNRSYSKRNYDDGNEYLLEKNVIDYPTPMGNEANLEMLEKRNHTESNEEHRPNIKFKISSSIIPLKLFVQKTDVIVKTKRQICQKYSTFNPDDYKSMKLSYNGKHLEDNQYLLSCVRGDNITVDCELDNTMDKREIIVLQLTGTIPVPELIQMHKYQTIADMRKIIVRRNSSREFITFTKNLKLDDILTLDECDLKDDDIVHVVDVEQQFLVIIFVFDNRDPLIVQCKNTDLVCDVKLKISDKLNMFPDEFILLSEKEYLNEEKYVFQYDIANGAEIRCCSWKRLDEETKTRIVKLRVHLDNIYYPMNLDSNVTVSVYGYSFQSILNIKESKALINEINKYQRMKHHPMFVHLHGFYHVENVFYVSMDLITGVPLLTYVDEHRPLDENMIAKLSRQILEGLQYLHEHNVVVRYMKASHIWIDKTNCLKISSFGLQRYLYGCDAQEMMTGFVTTEDRQDTYMPPEVNNSRPFEMASDVWIFGSLLHKMITNKSVYSGIGNEEMKRRIEGYCNIEYEQSNPIISPELKYFVEICLKGRPEDRPTVRELLLDPFIETNCA